MSVVLTSIINKGRTGTLCKRGFLSAPPLKVAMPFSFFFLWLPTLILKLQFAGPHIWIDHNDFDKDGDMHYSDRHENWDENSNSSEEGDGSGLFVKIVEPVKCNQTRYFSKEFTEIQALVEQSPEKRRWKESHSKNPTSSYLENSEERYVYLSKEIVEVESSDSKADEDDEDEPRQRENHKLPTHEKIVGGETISIKKMPFIAQILAQSAIRSSYGILRGKTLKIPMYCAGTIVTPRWVLTAAHCVAVPWAEKAASILVIAGVTGLAGFPKVGDKPQYRKAARLFPHPSWQGKEASARRQSESLNDDVHDIALVKVWKPFFFDGIHVTSIRIRGRPWFETVRKENCTIAGWGAREAGEIAVIPYPLKRLNVATLHGYTACPCIPKEVKEYMVCLGKDPLEGSCSGDSGQPIICDGEVVGVKSGRAWSPFLCSMRFFPTDEDSEIMPCTGDVITQIYTYTCPYLDWMKSYVGAAVPPKPESCSSVQLVWDPLITITLIALAVMVYLSV